MLQLKVFEEQDEKKWDDFVKKSENGTIFHQVSFLNYHGLKFKENLSYLMWSKGDFIDVVLPLGIFQEESRKIAKSPFGASWGGFVHNRKHSLKNAILIVENLLEYLKESGINEVIITPTPQPYYKNEYSTFFEFALINSGFKIVNRDIIHVADLNKNDNIWDTLDSKCRNQARKGGQYFKFKHRASIQDVYPVFNDDKVRLGSTMTHSEKDLTYLCEGLGIGFSDLAFEEDDNAKAAICYFQCNEKTILTFYMGQNESAKGKNGLNYLVLEGMLQAKKRGLRFFDFGTSSLGGKINNIGISVFKESFGATGFFRDTYKYTF